MIEAIHSYSQHTLIGVIAKGVPTFLDSLNSLVNHVATNIIIQIVISIPLFYLHHNLFALGFAVGFIFDKPTRALVEKVNTVYTAQQTLLERVLFFGGGGFLAILTMPTSMIFATLYYSSQWGALLYHNSKDRYLHPSSGTQIESTESTSTSTSSDENEVIEETGKNSLFATDGDEIHETHSEDENN